MRWHHRSAIVVRARTNSVIVTTIAPKTVAGYDIFALARSRSAGEYCARLDRIWPHFLDSSRLFRLFLFRLFRLVVLLVHAAPEDPSAERTQPVQHVIHV